MIYQNVRDFEAMIAEWAGSRYAVAVESGTAAIFLSVLYMVKARGYGGYVTIPSKTYPSVPCSIINAGMKVNFDPKPWEGVYELRPLDVIDGALRFRKGMYRKDSLHCLSFHGKKHLPIGRGGMILTDSALAVDWLKRARFDGRGEMPLSKDSFSMIGWNMYMTPEQAVRGIQLFEVMKDKELPDLNVEEQGYPDLSTFPVYHDL